MNLSNNYSEKFITNSSDILDTAVGIYEVEQSSLFFDNYEVMLDFDQSLIFFEELTLAFNFTLNYFLDKGPFLSIDIFRLDEIENTDLIGKLRCHDHIYSLFLGDEEILFSLETNPLLTEVEGAFFISYLMTSIEQYFLTYCSVNLKRGVYEHAISKIETPFALLSPEGDMIIHNSSFSNLKLFPKQCLEFKNDQKIELQGKLYYVYQSQVSYMGADNLSFVFFNRGETPQEEDSKCDYKEISSKELGIISSSIAHELNNPIAGILAGIELLRLDDLMELSGEKIVDDIYNSAIRIKELIRIFLGFSRLSLEKESKISPYEAFLNARNLIRFRMIESNICLDINKMETGEVFDSGIYSAIGAMTFYLIFNEILTSFAHFRLVVGEQSQGLNQDCLFYEYHDHIEIHFLKELQIRDKIEGLKLIEYLNKLSDLKMEIDLGRVVLYRSDH